MEEEEEEEENKQNTEQQNSAYSHREETRSHKTDKNNFGVHLRTSDKNNFGVHLLRSDKSTYKKTNYIKRRLRKRRRG